MKEIIRYLSLAAGGYFALRTLGVIKPDNSFEQSIKEWFDQLGPASKEADETGGGESQTGGQTGGGKQTGGGHEVAVFPPEDLKPPPAKPTVVTPAMRAASNAAVIVALVGQGVPEGLAAGYINESISKEALFTRAAIGEAGAIKLLDVVFKGVGLLTADQWNYFRNIGGKGQVTADLVDPAERTTRKISATEYHQLLTAFGVAGLGLIRYMRTAVEGRRR